MAKTAAKPKRNRTNEVWVDVRAVFRATPNSSAIALKSTDETTIKRLPRR